MKVLPGGLHKRLKEGHGVVNDGVDWYELKKCFRGFGFILGMKIDCAGIS